MPASNRPAVRFARRRAPLVLVALLVVGGCAQVLGLEEWRDPIGGAGGGGSAATSSGGSTGSTGGRPNVDPDNPTCADGVKNGLETDVDCGGDACPPCDNGKHCQNDADCAGHGCVANRCETSDGGPCVAGLAPTCHDCEKNGLETDVDCGGDACLPCAAGKRCKLDGDCMSSNCANSRCAPGRTGDPCRAAADCASNACVAGDCWSGLCCG